MLFVVVYAVEGQVQKFAMFQNMKAQDRNFKQTHFVFNRKFEQYIAYISLAEIYKKK